MCALLYAVEDVLEVYHCEYQDNEVLVCLDETSKQLVQETRTPLPPRPGAARAYDYECQRNGVSNLFMLFAPLEGWRRVEVTDRRTRTDWAEVVRKLVDEDYPNKERIVLVMDNLNTHRLSSLVRGLRASGGAAHRPTAGDTLQAEARELAEYSGDRTGGAGAAMPGPPDTQPGSSGTGNRSMAGATQPGRRFEWAGASPLRKPVSSSSPSTRQYNSGRLLVPGIRACCPCQVLWPIFPVPGRFQPFSAPWGIFRDLFQAPAPVLGALRPWLAHFSLPPLRLGDFGCYQLVGLLVRGRVHSPPGGMTV